MTKPLHHAGDTTSNAADTTNAFSFSNGINSLTVGVVDGDTGIVTTNSAITLTAYQVEPAHTVLSALPSRRTGGEDAVQVWQVGEEAVMVLSVDTPPEPRVLDRLRGEAGIHSVRVVSLAGL